VTLDVGELGRVEERIEVAAYFVVSEALANAAKHARASGVEVRVSVDGDQLRLSIHDDGVGGADPAHGSGLIGLRDRVEAVGGRIALTSPAGEGTTLVVELPL
jgi:signal transduction histidine kinase